MRSPSWGSVRRRIGRSGNPRGVGLVPLLVHFRGKQARRSRSARTIAGKAAPRGGGRPGMTTGGGSELVRRPNGSTRATLLELLFDVVFVAALALVSMLIADRSSW